MNLKIFVAIAAKTVKRGIKKSNSQDSQSRGRGCQRVRVADFSGEKEEQAQSGNLSSAPVMSGLCMQRDVGVMSNTLIL